MNLTILEGIVRVKEKSDYVIFKRNICSCPLKSIYMYIQFLLLILYVYSAPRHFRMQISLVTSLILVSRRNPPLDTHVCVDPL